MSKRRRPREPGPGPGPFEVQFTRAAERALASLPRADMRRVDAAIAGLAADQHPPGSKKLEGAEGLYRIRDGDCRGIYTIESRRLVVLVVSIGNRRDVYRTL